MVPKIISRSRYWLHVRKIKKSLSTYSNYHLLVLNDWTKRENKRRENKNDSTSPAAYLACRLRMIFSFIFLYEWHGKCY